MENNAVQILRSPPKFVLYDFVMHLNYTANRERTPYILVIILLLNIKYGKY